MRKVVLRWKNISLRGAKEISEILNICERLEILGHLAISEKSVTQLAEIKLKEGQTLENFSKLSKCILIPTDPLFYYLISLIYSIYYSNFNIEYWPFYSRSEISFDKTFIFI